MKSRLLFKKTANFTGKLLKNYKWLECKIFRILLKHINDHLLVIFNLHEYNFNKLSIKLRTENQSKVSYCCGILDFFSNHLKYYFSTLRFLCRCTLWFIYVCYQLRDAIMYFQKVDMLVTRLVSSWVSEWEGGWVREWVSEWMSECVSELV